MLHLHQGDGFGVLRGQADAGLAAIITDPPYGTTALPWDRAIDYAAFWEAAERATRETAVIVVFGMQPMLTDLITSNRRHFRYELIWYKTLPLGFLDAKLRPLRAHENIAVFCRKWRGARNAPLSTYNPQFWFAAPYAKHSGGRQCAHYGDVQDMIRGGNADGRRYPTDVLTFANRTGGTSPHPTAKPVELLRWLVATYTQPGDVVCDPFMGAGSTGVACMELGRSFVGAELDPGYFATAEARIGKAWMEAGHAAGT